MWLRQDLRLRDNPALQAAARRRGPIVAVYILCDAEEREFPPGGAARWWLHRSLSALGAELRSRGSRLSLLRGPWTGPNGVASAEQGVELLERLRDVGWLDEVELAASWALRRWPEAAPRIQPLCDEARRELAFEAGVRRLLYRGSGASRTDRSR